VTSPKLKNKAIANLDIVMGGSTVLIRAAPLVIVLKKLLSLSGLLPLFLWLYTLLWLSGSGTGLPAYYA